ncbi:hypothetical protein FE772_00855 [Lysobacter enzymogenes]|nr:hypothetical protein [Lysobacter enzymogenes]QCW24433.1 hypothetical protein FE772_00855 [Lysobacter enzymogenes]
MKVTAKTTGLVDTSKLTSLEITADRINETFHDMQVDSFRIQGSRLQGCVFSKIRSRQACLGSGPSMSYLDDCIFEGCDLRLSVAGNARLTRCRFVDSFLREVIAPNLELVECVFENTTISSAVFHGKVMADDVRTLGRSVNEFRGNNFSSAKLRDVGFNTGIVLADQVLPEGEEYLYIADTSAAVAWLKNAPVPKDRKAEKEYKGLLGLMSYYTSTGQKDQFMTGPFPPGFREAAATFGSLLA